MHLLYLQRGISLIELLITVVIAAAIIAGMMGVLGGALQTENAVRERNDLTQQVRFAMQRMTAAVQGTRRLILPLANNPITDWRDNVREETVPASAPEGSSTKATAVLAVTLDPTIDRNRDGWADANNDKDFMDLDTNGTRGLGEPERIDEDPPGDLTNDAASGIISIDDDGDGEVDEQQTTLAPDGNLGPLNDDDDEDDVANEDPWNGIDDDGDGTIDEDTKKDVTHDGIAGIPNFDDDGDSVEDEGDKNDDDEDGQVNEDWLDPVVYYLSGSNLIERLPALTDTNGDTFVTGADFNESVIAENVTNLRIERIAQGTSRALLVDITLALTNPATGKITTLHSLVRVGGSQ